MESDFSVMVVHVVTPVSSTVRGFPILFSVTHDWGFYFSAIRDSWYKSILHPLEFEF